MVPAMTAREKIARAAAELVIEKDVPAVVPLGAGKVTSAAGGQADRGRDPAGIRNAAVIASVAGSGGRAIRAAETMPGTARHAVTRLAIVSANRSVGVRRAAPTSAAPKAVATTPAAVAGVADVTTGDSASAAPATDARPNNGIGAAAAGRIGTTAVAARNVATAVRADSAATTASLQPGRDRAASPGPAADGRARGGRDRAGVARSVGPAGRVAPTVVTAPQVGRTRAAPDVRAGMTARSGVDGATSEARSAALAVMNPAGREVVGMTARSGVDGATTDVRSVARAARRPAGREVGEATARSGVDGAMTGARSVARAARKLAARGTTAPGAIGRHPPTGAGRTARTPGAGLRSACGATDARRAASGAGTVRGLRSVGSGVQKAVQKAEQNSRAEGRAEGTAGRRPERRDERGFGGDRRSEPRADRGRGDQRRFADSSDRPRRGADRPSSGQHRPDSGAGHVAPKVPEPALTDDITAAELDAEVRRDLRGLQSDTADTVARHLVAAGRLVDEDTGTRARARAVRAAPGLADRRRA